MTRPIANADAATPGLGAVWRAGDAPRAAGLGRPGRAAHPDDARQGWHHRDGRFRPARKAGTPT